MIWQRTVCQKEVNDARGPGGLLIQGDAFGADLGAHEGGVQCVYIDPPFFTGKRFAHRMRVGEAGWLDGSRFLDLAAYDDFPGLSFEEYLSFVREAAVLSRNLLNASGSFFLHVDYRASAHARIICDEVFGKDRMVNEIIWSYQTGGRSRKHFSRKHDTILMYAKTGEHFFDISQVPSSRKTSRSNHLKRCVDESGRSYRTITSNGKQYVYYDDEPSYPDDVWTDVSHMQQKDPQRTGYATQKPQALLDRIILCCTRPGDIVADPMCGSGTTLAAAAASGRRFIGVDLSAQAFSVCRKRLAEVRLESRAPFSEVSAMLDASLLTGIGYYSVGLNAYTLPADAFDGLDVRPPVEPGSLDAVDQWYAGLLNGGTFTAFASSCRRKQTPAIDRSLMVPLLRGTVAVMVIDILGNRSLWACSGQL